MLSSHLVSFRPIPDKPILKQWQRRIRWCQANIISKFNGVKIMSTTSFHEYLSGARTWKYRRALIPSISMVSLLTAVSGVAGEPFMDKGHKPNYLVTELVNTTQGTFWPPATVVDKEGNYILVGTNLEQTEQGIRPVPFQAVIVSKNTVPPLNSSGVEDFSQPFSASYSVVRRLDLSKHSPDWKIPLYTQSYGPYEGNFGGGGRSPKLGDSPYNLNALGGPGWEAPCPEIFPTESQRKVYTRERKALHEAIIPGFKGDQVSYDVDTGREFTPINKNGSDCPPEGCAGEDDFDARSDRPITLGDYLKLKAVLTVKLTRYNNRLNGYTAARFTVEATDLLPNSLYLVVLGHSSFLQGSPLLKLAHPASTPAIIATDDTGRGRLSFKVKNPFPSPALDDAGKRVVALGLVLKSDYMAAGMCNFRFAPSVDVHAVASTIGDGNPDDFDALLTVSPD